jgi:hypothetical protein
VYKGNTEDKQKYKLSGTPALKNYIKKNSPY